MKSFSEFIKFEILNFNWATNTEYLLEGFLKTSSTLKEDNLLIKITIKGMSDKIFSILKNKFGTSIKRIKNNLLTNNKDIINLFNRSINLSDEQQSKAFVAGTFLSKGLCNKPENKHFHLEIRQKNIQDAINLKDIIFSLGIKTKEINKNGWYFLYLKNPNYISDFLKLVNANEAMLIFEEEKIRKDFISSTNRLSSFEKINLIKTDNASKAQIEKIKNLIVNKKIDTLPLKVKRAYELRIQNKNLSLNDFTSLYNSKYKTTFSISAINHWFRKLK